MHGSFGSTGVLSFAALWQSLGVQLYVAILATAAAVTFRRTATAALMVLIPSASTFALTPRLQANGLSELTVVSPLGPLLAMVPASVMGRFDSEATHALARMIVWVFLGLLAFAVAVRPKDGWAPRRKRAMQCVNELRKRASLS
ncbi:hypothetical protein [Nocardioides sp. B-3]|uniref:hypothetical protein n=1 Tax=Nocardioides sp. B-3 TaxID=2895565 RepID=UPI002152DEDE|nr:hypothetical protein [Nocardioides sp. B-3]UUZ60902.1 hypothetical protein LP418_09390 [Nocardioides sp. B-3]